MLSGHFADRDLSCSDNTFTSDVVMHKRICSARECQDEVQTD